MTPTAARALVVGALAPALGAAAHVEAGGGLPEVTAAVVAVAFLTAGLAALVVRRRVGVVRLVGVLAAGQVGWHLAMGPSGEHAGHTMSHHVTATPSPGMLAAHAAATVLVALGAAGADRAVGELVARRVGTVLALLGARPPAPSSPVAAAAPPAVRGRDAALLLRVRPLRGPPVRPAG
ncbi:hypothetical protein WCD74_04975 [Actinomycetospora sp. OC33-EN08]|uniref:MFS transporter n=1 Tax=Actinomycetospora aurantiaca TaxID=3129233 RepID=A0ABU8MIG8_9PSEU